MDKTTALIEAGKSRTSNLRNDGWDSSVDNVTGSAIIKEGFKGVLRHLVPLFGRATSLLEKNENRKIYFDFIIHA